MKPSKLPETTDGRPPAGGEICLPFAGQIEGVWEPPVG